MIAIDSSTSILFWCFFERKKKKSRSSTSQSTRRGDASHHDADIQEDIAKIDRKRKDDDATPGVSGEPDEEEESPTAVTTSNMTEAEKKFEMMRRKRLADRVAKQARLSHKDRVDAFNRDLESRTEHFAMGRVGGGG